MARVQLALAGVLALIAVVLGTMLLKSQPDDGRPFTIGPSGLAGALPPPDLPVRDFVLADQDGRRAVLSDSRGDVTVLTFLYSTCRDTCPVMASQIESALDSLPAAGPPVATLAVSVDPASDTPRRARSFLAARGLTGRMRFLLGDRRALRAVWSAYGIQPRDDSGDPRAFEHSSYVAVLDGTGRQRSSFPIDHLEPEALAHDVRRLQQEAAGRAPKETP